jgi:hypothetical protein
MPKMAVRDVQTMLAAERASALAAITSEQLMNDRASAMAYYQGDMSQDMPAQEGRSKAVSTDVSDIIEGLMPQLMDIIAGTDEIVRFEPVGPEDEEAAQQETDYVNHVLMQLNDGWQVLYDFAKDGLLSKTGICKVWWEEREQEERETYYDLTEEQYQALAYAVEMSDGAMKVVAHTAHNEAEETPADEAKEPSEATS